jgi:hypothetical protein
VVLVKFIKLDEQKAIFIIGTAKIINDLEKRKQAKKK